MITSRDRILTTHVGSLPRNEALSELLVRREAGEKIDEAQLAKEMDNSVAYVVDRQVEAGIDIGNDGEQQRVGFQTYVPQRMSGFGGESNRPVGRDVRGIPRTARHPAPAVSQAQPRPERAAGDRGGELFAIPGRSSPRSLASSATATANSPKCS